MQIFIPTYGRSKFQGTWNQLPKILQTRTVLVVQKREAKLYPNLPILVLPEKIKTIAPTRQFILEYAIKKKIEKFVMLDDDLRFDIRRKDENNKFYVATESQKLTLFDKIEKALQRYAHVGVLAREGGNRVLESYKLCSRMMRILAYNTNVLKYHKIRFDRLPLMEDFDVTLQLLRRGVPNIVLCAWVQGQGGSGAKGGCSHFRTLALHNACANRLSTLHSQFVKVVEKQTKSAWGGQARLDVHVQWKKAYESAP